MSKERLTVNGDSRPYRRQTVRELLETLDVDLERRGVAVAVNAAVVPRDEWNETELQPGDRVEVVHAIAGG